MRALQLPGWKQAPAFRDVPEPDPGPGQVVIKVAGAGACHSDLHLMHDFEEGVTGFSPPFTLGHENAGWVQALGAGVERLDVGQPVAVYGPWGCGLCRRCRLGMENYCELQPGAGILAGGLGADGGMAPLMLVPAARFLVPLDDLDPVEAAPLTDAGLTPYHAIKPSLGKLVPGTTAVAIGVGGLGHLGVQILRALTSARIIAVDARDEALALAREAGADVVVKAGDDAVAEIRDATKGKRADLVLDFVGVDATMAMAARVARPLADVVIVGIGGGAFRLSFFSSNYEVSYRTTYWGSVPELFEVLALAEAGRIKPHVQRFALDDGPEVYERLDAGLITGRAVVVPG